MKKGQIFSLDLLFAMILIVLAIGTTIQLLEQNSFNSKEFQEKMKLKQIGETAAELLLTNPIIICEEVSESGLLLKYVNNCIPKINAAPARITLEDMGIPNGYNCKIDNEAISAGTWQTNCIQTTLPEKDNIYSTQRKILLYSGTGSPEQKKQIKKVDLETCMGLTVEGTCKLNESVLTLWVWKE